VRLLFAAIATFVSLGSAAQTATERVPPFAHVVVVVFENKEYENVIGSPYAPTFNRLVAGGALLTNYDGVSHPSLPNYLALVSGSTHDIHSDCTTCTVRGPSLADTLRTKGRTWKAYVEGLPRPGYTGAFFQRYAKKHDPFLYFRNVLRSPAKRKLVVPLAQLSADAADNKLPSFALVVPDLCHSMHDCSVSTGDAWLHSVVEPLLKAPALTGSVVFVVFDEGSTNVGGGGHVPALALGPAVRPGSRYARATNHYGLLATIETAWSLPRLGQSRTAAPITGIWR
jgi:phospholipase C